jgi:CRISPR-associated protein Cas1
MARAFVAAKVRAAREVLVRYRRNGGEVCPLALEQLESADSRIGVAGNIAVLMGIEGSAARNYFQQLMQQNKSSFTWAGRRRRPSRDPINALLSLGYTLVGNELRALCFTCGLDPCLGFLHTPEDGRPALALDLLEICRHPIVDRLTLTVINRGIFKADDFRGYDDPDGLFLETDAFKRYARAYEEWMEEPPPANSDDPRPMTRRDAVKTEVLRLVSTLDRDAPYEPGSIPV